MTAAWKFRDAPNTACYTTTDVLNGAQVKYVYHDYDGDWQFHGETDETTVSSIQIACLAEMIKYNHLLAGLHDLPCGWRSEWNESARNWDRFKDNPFPTFAENGYYLEDAVWLSKYLTDIKPPPAEMRENLKIASHVKIVFRFAHEDSYRDDGQCERLWVEVTAVDEQNEGYIGRIDNAPYHKAVKYGDFISFHFSHVADCYSEG